MSGSDSSESEEELQEIRPPTPFQVLEEEIVKILEEIRVKSILLQKLTIVKKEEELYEERLAKLLPMEKIFQKATKEGKPGSSEKLQKIQTAMKEQKKKLKEANDEVVKLESELSGAQ